MSSLEFRIISQAKGYYHNTYTQNLLSHVVSFDQNLGNLNNS